jgi:hypothetical protein
MMKLKIRIFKNNDHRPDTTMTMPLGIIKVASKLVPRKAVKILDDLGIDLNQIVDISKTEEPLTLAEIEEHKKHRKIIISIE